MTRQTTPLGTLLRGLAAAAVGTAAMDVQQYVWYRLGGGTTGFLHWEFGGIENWEQASVPGQVGKRLIAAWTGHELAPEWAGLTNNVMHWGFGVQWGALYGITAGSLDRPPLWTGLPFGAFVWAVSYTVLPLGHFYKPPWEYKPTTLAKDLGTHLVYGGATGVVFRLLSAR